MPLPGPFSETTPVRRDTMAQVGGGVDHHRKPAFTDGGKFP
jgi:hypothetical protein